jgi:16S rRNA processing protein RimM
MSTAESRKESGAARQSSKFLAVGRIVRPHGIRGALLVDPISEQLLGLKPGAEVRMGAERTPMIFRELHRHGGRWLLSLEGVASREQADLLRGQEIALPLEDVPPLPEGTYYHWQILGLRVVSDDGANLGTVVEILQTGANDVYVVRNDEGRDLLLPAIESVILEVDLDGGQIKVRLIPGLLG